MEVIGAAFRASTAGPADWFTGQVWMDEIATLPEPGLVRSLRMHFSPGARTAWHAHPLGQVLHVVDGVGRVQAKGSPVVEVRQPARENPAHKEPGGICLFDSTGWSR